VKQERQQLAYRPAEAAQLLGVPRRTLTDLLAKGEIRHVRFGAGKRRKRTLITREALAEFLAKNEVHT